MYKNPLKYLKVQECSQSKNSTKYYYLSKKEYFATIFLPEAYSIKHNLKKSVELARNFYLFV